MAVLGGVQQVHYFNFLGISVRVWRGKAGETCTLNMLHVGLRTDLRVPD